MKSENGITPPRSMADQIYDSLWAEIISAGIPWGKRLFEKDIAESYQTSRTPVREAFRRLEQDCLVERVAQGGVKVAEISSGMLGDLFSLREVLEAHAIGQACRRITPEELQGLKQISGKAGKLLPIMEVDREYALTRFTELNSEFHQAIYDATKNKFLIRMIRNMRGMLQGMRAVSIQAVQACQEAWEEHRRLIGHLENRDDKAAVSLIREHIRSAYSQVMSMREPGDDPQDAAPQPPPSG